MSSSKTSLTYKDSGVDINAGNELIQAIKDDVKKSRIPGVLGGLGGFGGLFEFRACLASSQNNYTNV